MQNSTEIQMGLSTDRKVWDQIKVPRIKSTADLKEKFQNDRDKASISLFRFFK